MSASRGSKVLAPPRRRASTLQVVRRLGSASVACALGLGVWLGSGSARADVPPGPNEPDCSVASAQAQGLTDCQQCDTYHAEPDKCSALATQGLTQNCRSSGASVWHEVWCKGEAASPPAEQKPSGCGACATGNSGPASPAALALGLGLLAGAVGRRRKRA